MEADDAMNIEKLRYEKAEILKELLEYIRSKLFTGAEADVERYQKYVNKKEKYIERLKQIDNSALTQGAYKEVNSPEIKELAKQIVEADKKISDKMSVLFDELKVKTKNSKLTRKVNRKYSIGYSGIYSSFDFKG